MKILLCLFCGGEVKVVEEFGFHKKIKCTKCCHGCEDHAHFKKDPEVYFYKKKKY